MNTAIFGKTIYEQRWFILLTLLGCALFPIIFMHAVESFDIPSATAFLEHPFIQGAMRALTGVDISVIMSSDALAAFPFVHPAMLALGWVYMISVATRSLAGEIENGTAELLIALPLSRWKIYLSVTVWMPVACTLIGSAAWLGAAIGLQTTTHSQAISAWSLRYVVLNHGVMLFAVAGVATLISAVSTRRGKAMALAFAILLTSFLLNWLAVFWEPAQGVAFVGILHYYRPYLILQAGSPLWSDLAVLILVGSVAWGIGGVIFTKRDVI